MTRLSSWVQGKDLSQRPPGYEPIFFQFKQTMARYYKCHHTLSRLNKSNKIHCTHILSLLPKFKFQVNPPQNKQKRHMARQALLYGTFIISRFPCQLRAPKKRGIAVAFWEKAGAAQHAKTFCKQKVGASECLLRRGGAEG